MKKNRIYFIGIGGIGMSALARYFLDEGWTVGGYDRAESDLTRRLSDAGAKIHYEDDVKLIPDEFLDPELTAWSTRLPCRRNIPNSRCSASAGSRL